MPNGGGPSERPPSGLKKIRSLEKQVHRLLEMVTLQCRRIDELEDENDRLLTLLGRQTLDVAEGAGTMIIALGRLTEIKKMVEYVPLGSNLTGLKNAVTDLLADREAALTRERKLAKALGKVHWGIGPRCPDPINKRLGTCLACKALAEYESARMRQCK